MRTTIATLAAAIILLWTVPAQAILITVDPGAPGTIMDEFVLPFTDLNGTPLDGQQLVLDFDFLGALTLEVDANGSISPDLEAELVLEHNAGVAGSGTTDFVSLLDNSQNAIVALPTTGELFFTTASIYFGGEDLSVVDGMQFFGVNLTVTLPDLEPGEITAGRLNIRTAGSGEMKVLNAVPESSAFLLMGMTGLVACGYTGWKRYYK